MDANETDFVNAKDPAIVAGQVDDLAGGIMDLLEETNPNFSGVAQPKKEEPPKEQAKGEPEEPEETEGEESEETYTIKWQGQEKEVTQQELLELASKGFDYTQKTQQLAQERDQLASYQGLANRIKADPTLAKQIADLIAGQPVQKPVEKKFDDPIEQLKWETKQEALAEARKEIQQNLAPLHRQQALNQVRMQVQADPDYREIHQKIIEMVQAQPPAIQKTVYLQLDQDPQAYLSAFQHFKNQKAQTSPPETEAKVKKRETKAPFVDAGGVSSPEVAQNKEQRQKLSKQKAAALRSGNPIEIAKWIQDSGAIEHLY